MRIIDETIRYYYQNRRTSKIKKKKKKKKKEVNMLYIKWRMIKLDVTTNKYVYILSFWVSIKKN